MSGYLHLITGPMMSGKTSRLITVIEKLSIFKNIYIINSSLDNRYNNNSITTHNKKSIKANSFEELELNYNKLQKIREEYDVIALDEIQFFSKLTDFIKICLQLNFHIIACGLNGNYLQEPFGEVINLIPLCDKIEFLKGYCIKCKNGTKGSFTKRISKNNNEILVGNENIYQCVCRKHL